MDYIFTLLDSLEGGADVLPPRNARQSHRYDYSESVSTGKRFAFSRKV